MHAKSLESTKDAEELLEAQPRALPILTYIGQALALCYKRFFFSFCFSLLLLFCCCCCCFLPGEGNMA